LPMSTGLNFLENASSSVEPLEVGVLQWITWMKGPACMFERFYLLASCTWIYVKELILFKLVLALF
jgi:hypothetical protein